MLFPYLQELPNLPQVYATGQDLGESFAQALTSKVG
jgi:hypothetical protein